MSQLEFSNLPLPRKELAPEVMHRYRVYAEGTFKLVEAASALEALKQTGLANVTRVERDSIDHYPVLDMEAMDTILAQPEAAIKEAAPVEVVAAPAAEEPAQPQA